jgi:chitinase
VTTPTGTATSGISSEPSASSYTTSTVYTTSTYTVTSCAATITDCPAKIGSVTTETIALYTTVCPVTASETSNSVSIKPASYSTSTIYTNFISTITSCATTVTDCPAASIKLTTIKIAISTTLCPITEPQSTHLPAVASSAGVVGIVSASKASSISTEYTTLPVSSTTSIALSGNTGSSRNSTVTAASATPTSASFTGAGAAGFGVPSSLWLTCISILALLN